MPFDFKKAVGVPASQARHGHGKPPHSYLWITWTDPHPERDGQRIYSGQLIDAVAQAGASIDVLCFESDDPGGRVRPAPQAPIRWHRVMRSERPRALSPLSTLPNVAFRSGTAKMRAKLRQLLNENSWDAIVLDGLPTGWAVGEIERLPAARRPRVVHISHNHEASTRGAVARDYRGNPLMKLALRWDSLKARYLEERMVDVSSLVTAITEDDAEKYQCRHPGKELLVLPPGYAGTLPGERHLSPSLPRRAVVVGSFHWVAKKMNLEAFLSVADPLFAEAGAELQIVGSGDPEFLDQLRQRMQATEIVGPVDDVVPYMQHARAAVVPERTGGGFKLKILDYVFNHLPILAIDGSVAGTPLRAPDSVRLYDDLGDLARGAVSLLDDVEAADRIQCRAFDLCRDRFDWEQRGRRLLAETAAA